MEPTAAQIADLVRRSRCVLSIPLQIFDDELLSSWIVRLADAQATSVQRLSYRLLGRGRQLFCFDLDRGAWGEPIIQFAQATGQDQAALQRGTFLRYEGVLFEEVARAHRWILPVVKRGTARSGFGVQYCPHCLASDRRPYIRLDWRLAFVCWCPLHRMMLRDRCASCGANVVPQAVRTGRSVKWDVCSMLVCHRCGADRRREAKAAGDVVDEQGLQLQEAMLARLHGDLSEDAAGASLHPLSYFQGLAVLWSFLDSPSSAPLRISLDRGLQPRQPPRDHRYGSFETQPVADRAAILGSCSRLLNGGIDAAIERLRAAGYWSSDIHRFRGRPQTGEIPFWLWEPLHLNLNNLAYSPSSEEIDHAIDHVLRTTDSGFANVRDVCVLLGMKTKCNQRVSSAVLAREVGRGRSRLPRRDTPAKRPKRIRQRPERHTESAGRRRTLGRPRKDAVLPPPSCADEGEPPSSDSTASLSS